MPGATSSDADPRPGWDASRIIAALTIWGGRLAWLVVAVVGGRAVGNAVSDHDLAAARGLTVAAWAAWTVGAMAFLVPSVVGLTVLRVVVPGALVVAVAARAGDASAGAVLALTVPALVATVLVLAADVGRAWVQASAYGDEQRFPLRPPVGYLAASIASWLVWAVAVIAAVVAWSAEEWSIAALGTIVALAGAATLPRRWHQLSRRWLVTVPAGLVVHDPVVLGETLMLPRRQIAAVRLTRVRPHRVTSAADLSGPTAGVGVEVALHEAATALFPPRPGRAQGQAIHLTALVVAPSRPGAALADARRRRLPVA